MLRTASLVVLLAAFWLLLSGHVDPLLIVLGAGSVLVVIWLVARMSIVDHESVPVHLGLGLPRYCGWLAGRILTASVTVARQAWSPRLSLTPAVERTPADELSELSRVIYANSIILTPGTLSLSVRDDGIDVHSLRRSDLVELHGAAMLDRVGRLERR